MTLINIAILCACDADASPFVPSSSIVTDSSSSSQQLIHHSSSIDNASMRISSLRSSSTLPPQSNSPATPRDRLVARYDSDKDSEQHNELDRRATEDTNKRGERKQHSQDCKRVLVKYHSHPHVGDVDYSSLRWEAAMHQMINSSVGNNNHESSSSSLSVLSSSTSISPLNTPNSSSDASPAIVPFNTHMRQLDDGRWSLIMNDIEGGVTIKQWIDRIHHPSASSPSDSTAQGTHSSSTSPSSADDNASTSSINTILASFIIALSLCNKLRRLHQCGIIHKSMAPCNIMIQPPHLSSESFTLPSSSSSSSSSSCDVQFLDLSSASLLVKDRAESESSYNHQHQLQHQEQHQLISYWSFRSPEHTGKANRMIDARSDFYTIGAIMYNMIVGRPPFESNDVLELIHLIVAKSPPSMITKRREEQRVATSIVVDADGSATIKIDAIKSSCSSSPSFIDRVMIVVDGIVRKLLSKQAESRYQSIEGLIADITFVIDTIRYQLVQSSLSSSSSSAQYTNITESSSAVELTAASSSSSSAPRTVRIDSNYSSIASFVVGHADVCSQFRLSQKLYGCNASISLLQSSYAMLMSDSLSRVGDATALLSSSSSIIGRGLNADSINRNRPRLLLVSGAPGSGKSSLVNEIHRLTVRDHGMYVKAKFDEHRIGDSSVILNAFNQLVLRLSCRDDAPTWRDRMLTSLNSNGAVITDVIRDLTRLIGHQPSVPILSAADASIRFNATMMLFVSCLSTVSHPLILFVDDLQWSDASSIALLRSMMNNESACMLLIGAYRNIDDVDHPLSIMIDSMKLQCDVWSRVTEVSMTPLTPHHIRRLLIDSFRCDDDETTSLVDILFLRTRGNPHHIRTLLSSYHDNGWIAFNRNIGVNGQWMLNIDDIRSSSTHSDDVVDVINNQMRSMSTPIQSLLMYAAVAASTWSMRCLHVITRIPVAMLARYVRELEQAGIMVVIDNDKDLCLLSNDISMQSSDANNISSSIIPISPLSLPHQSLASRLESIRIRFVHDRTYVAAFNLVPKSELSHIRCDIVRRALDAYTIDELNVFAIEVTGHINEGGDVTDVDHTSEWSSMLSDDATIGRIIDLEILAGRRSKGSLSFATAVVQFSAALKLIQRRVNQQDNVVTPPATFSFSSSSSFIRVNSACWSSFYSTLVSLHLDLSQSLFQLSHYAEAQRCIEYALSRITLILDRGPYFELHVQSYNQQNRLQEGQQIGLNHLAEIDVTLSMDMSDEMKSWIFAFADVNDESTFSSHPMFSLPPMTSPIDRLAMTLMGAIGPNLYIMTSPLLLPNSITMLALSRRSGFCSESALALALAAINLWSEHNTHALERSYALARVAHLLMDREIKRGHSANVVTQIIVTSLVYPWSLPLVQCIDQIGIIFEKAVRRADWESAAYSGATFAGLTTVANNDLLIALPRQQRVIDVLVTNRISVPMNAVRSQLQFNKILAGMIDPSVAYSALNRSSVDPTLQLPIHYYFDYLHAGAVFYFNRRFGEAIVPLELAYQCVLKMPSSGTNACANRYRCLNLLTSCPTIEVNIDSNGAVTFVRPIDYDAALVDRNLIEAEMHIGRFTVWSAHAPHNFAHHVSLMKAEYSRVKMFHSNQHELMIPTMTLYDDAIDQSHRHKFNLAEGVSLEAAARFYIAIHRRSYADQLLHRSFSAYCRFGCVLKMNQLRSEFDNIQFDVASQHDMESMLASIVASRLEAMSQQIDEASSEMTTEHLPILSHTRESSAPLSSSSSLPSDAPPLLHPNSWPYTTHRHASLSSTRSTTRQSSDASTRSSSRRSSDASFQYEPVAPHQSSSLVSSLDMMSLLKALMSISCEKDQSILLSKLNAIIMESAGASRSAVVMIDATTKQFVIEVDNNIEVAHPSHSTSSSTTSRSRNVPTSLLRYCVSNNDLVSINTPSTSIFSDDPYFASSSSPSSSTHTASSILCLPLVTGGVVFGCLYLEHYTVDFFTSAHIDLLRLLCGQASLSIDNARLYQQLSNHNATLEIIVKQRTSEIEEKNRLLIIAKDDADDAKCNADEAKLKAEEATRIKSTFLSNMSHEIRTPMNAVLGIGRLLAATVLSSEQQQYVDMINNSGNLLLTIINDILDFSKIEAGELCLTMKRHNILDTVETAAMLVYDMARVKGLQFSWCVDQSIPADLMIDATRLQQILLNLCSNAIKFTHKGEASIIVTVRRLTSVPSESSSPVIISSIVIPSSSQQVPTLNLTSHPSSMFLSVPPMTPSPSLLSPSPSLPSISKYVLEFAVRDTGIGITPSQLQKLFRSFAQVQHSSGEYGGTGLGLVISKRLIEAMGGTIVVTSEITLGSLFTFTINASQSSAFVLTPSSALSPGITQCAADSSPVMLSANNAQHVSPSPIMSVTPHALCKISDDQRQQLSSARIVYIGDSMTGAQSFTSMLKYYASNVVTFTSTDDAIAHLQAALVTTTTTTTTMTVLEREPYAVTDSIDDADQSRSSASQHSECIIIIADMDAIGMTENELMDRFNQFTRKYCFIHSSTSSRGADRNLATQASAVTPAVIIERLTKPFRMQVSLDLLLRMIARSAEPSTLTTMLGQTQSHDFCAAGKPSPSSMLRGGSDSPAPPCHSPEPSSSSFPSSSPASSPTPGPSSSSSSSSRSKIANLSLKYPLRVLLAEDNVINQKVMSMLMNKLGYTSMLIACNGVEALATLDREHARGSEYDIECILMDASMDVMDGMECTRRIRQEQSADRVRPFIIAQTANVTDEYRDACMSAGMDRFITKPIRLDAISVVLKEAYCDIRDQRSAKQQEEQSEASTIEPKE